MPTEVIKSASNSTINIIGRIWLWKHFSQVPKSPDPDVLLPYGGLFEMEKMSLRDLGENTDFVAVLPNQDIVRGPTMVSLKKEDALEAGNITRDFRLDMVYLKKAMYHKTIVLSDLPRR